MNISEDIVTKVFSEIDFEEILDYLIQEIKAKNYLITRVSNIDNIHDRDVLKSPLSLIHI